MLTSLARFLDSFNENSDVDFLVNLKDNLNPVAAGVHLWDLTFELEDLLCRNVDLLTERALKNPYFIMEINQSKFLIYE